MVRMELIPKNESSKRNVVRLFHNQQPQNNENGNHDDDKGSEQTHPTRVVAVGQKGNDQEVDTTINNRQEGEDDKARGSNDTPFTPPTMERMTNLLPSRWKLVVGYIVFISFWPFLAWIQLYLRTHEFDIDTYLTVKGMLDTAADNSMMNESSSSSSSSSNDITIPQSILELPPLSPAERLVDSLFGPPNVDRRGF